MRLQVAASKLFSARNNSSDEKEIQSSEQRLQKMQELHESAAEFLSKMQQFIDRTRLVHPRFVLFSDNLILKLLSTTFSEEEAKQLVLECFQGMKSVRFDDGQPDYL